MSLTATLTRLLVSQDGRSAANVPAHDLGNPLYKGWTDCTELDDERLHFFTAGRQIMTHASAVLASIDQTARAA